ncbi:MAG: SDR family oxidoreductase [Marinosulfonomonas sp.]|nr:SDR family oxidoreductase [Marinosulfonomonas sp.]
MTLQNGPFLVTGAAGNLGGLVLNKLIEAGVGPLIATSRSPEKLADVAAKGVEVRTADFNDPATLGSAFNGVKRLLIVSTDDLEPGKRLIAHANAIDAAVKAGIEHIVYTSLTNPVDASPITFSADHKDTEKMLADSGLSYTVLRNNLYADLLLMSAPQSIAMGKHFTATGTGKTGYVTRQDCANAAAAALMNEASTRTLDITGPATVSHDQIAKFLSEITGTAIPHIAISDEDLQGAMVANGLPAFMAKVFASFDVAVDQGYLDVASGALEELTGKPGKSVLQFLKDNKAALTAPQS